MSKKPRAVLMGPCVGELGWEILRFAPILPFYKRKKYKNQDITFIVLTREDRFDLYGKNADILVPLEIEGDYINCLPNCFRLEGLSNLNYKSIAKQFKNLYSNRFKIVEHIYPVIDGKKFLHKHQFNSKQMIYKFLPRKENYNLIEDYLPSDKKIVVISPRYRDHSKHPKYKSIGRRNWCYWPQFFDRLYNHKDLMKKYNFILCGKPGEYIPDEKNRFFDINKVTLGDRSSLVGLLIIALQKSVLTISSQSAIPNLSLLIGTPVLEWGHQRKLHSVTYNINNVKIKYLDDRKYKLPVKTIMNNVEKLLL